MDPSFVSAYVGEADCYKSLGSYNQAITAYSQAIKADPANPALYVGRSGIYQLNGESGHASEDCASAEKHSVPTIATAEQIATCYATTENYGAESSALARALKHFPTSSDLYRTKSSVDQVTGDTQAALADYEQAFALARSAAQQGQALSTGGDLYASQGDYAGAVAEYKEATKVAPFLIDPWVGLATALATEGQTEPAADVYEAAERAPGMTANSRALEYRAHGNLLQQLGDQGKAVTAWRTALRLTTDPALRAQLRQTLASVGA
jgi:tetratricopeptide (TPR) repeat protein